MTTKVLVVDDEEPVRRLEARLLALMIGSASRAGCYASVSIISADRVVFNIKGNDYRLVLAVEFDKVIVWIKWIGTHKEYDKIDVNEVDHEG